MKPASLSTLFLTAIATLHPLHAATVVWTNGTANNAWSTAGNWDPATEPTATSEVIFPASLAGTITTTTENAVSLRQTKSSPSPTASSSSSTLRELRPVAALLYCPRVTCRQ